VGIIIFIRRTAATAENGQKDRKQKNVKTSKAGHGIKNLVQGMFL